MSDIQTVLNTMLAHGRTVRSSYHLTLGKAIKALEAADPSLPALCNGSAMGPVDSYRGYYDDLAFRPNGDLHSVGDVLANLRKALGSTFEGYKGGDFTMGEDTPLWVAPYGSCGDAVVGLVVRDDAVEFLTKQLD